MRTGVTQPSLCSVPACVQPIGGGEEGPRAVRQQRAARHGRVSVPLPAGSEPESAASPGNPRSVREPFTGLSLLSLAQTRSVALGERVSAEASKCLLHAGRRLCRPPGSPVPAVSHTGSASSWLNSLSFTCMGRNQPPRRRVCAPRGGRQPQRAARRLSFPASSARVGPAGPAGPPSGLPRAARELDAASPERGALAPQVSRFRSPHRAQLSWMRGRQPAARAALPAVSRPLSLSCSRAAGRLCVGPPRFWEGVSAAPWVSPVAGSFGSGGVFPAPWLSSCDRGRR